MWHNKLSHNRGTYLKPRKRKRREPDVARAARHVALGCDCPCLARWKRSVLKGDYPWTFYLETE